MRLPWLTEIRGRVPFAATLVLGAVPIILLAGLWWSVTAGETYDDRIVSGTIMPSPAEVGEALKTLIVPTGAEQQGLLAHARISLTRVGCGYLIALVVVLPLGILMGAFGTARAALSPLTTAGSYIPIAALVPLTMSLWGTDEKQKIYFLAIAFAVSLLPGVIQAIDSVPDVYLRTSSTLGASRRQVIGRVLIPIALPDLWHSMRLAFAVGWTYLVLVEVVVMSGGLGYLIGVAQRRAKPGQVWLVILIITLIAWAADLTWDRAGRLLFPYRKR